MELWIRSQDRMKLCNAKVFSLDNDQTGIFCNSCEDSYVFAGKYKTKERALEVLDEIQKILIGRLIIKTNRKVGSEDLNRLANFFDTKHVINDNEFEFIQPEATNIIYEMPKE